MGQGSLILEKQLECEKEEGRPLISLQLSKGNSPQGAQVKLQMIPVSIKEVLRMLPSQS